MHLALFSMPGGFEWLIIFAIMLLLFGKRLPEVGRSIGRGIWEFKRGIAGEEPNVSEAKSLPSTDEKKT